MHELIEKNVGVNQNIFHDITFCFWLTGWLSWGQPPFQRVYVFIVYHMCLLAREEGFPESASTGEKQKHTLEDRKHAKKHLHKGLEAQQRYFSYRETLVAIVSQNFLVFVFLGYYTIIARYVARWGIAQMCLCKTKCQGGYRNILCNC